jgi:3-hydroxybutyryl-CoA dehydrogenase
MNDLTVNNALIVGAGVMGHSIAQVFAQNGTETSLVDIDEKSLDRARVLVKNNLETLAEYGKIKSADIPDIIKRIQFTKDLPAACKRADFVIEAVHEVPATKKSIFSILSRNCREDAILASNTSGLDIFSIVDVSKPERLIITHWFAPPHIIPLVEVVPGKATSSVTTEFTARLMKKLGKTTVVMKEFIRSFLVNRLQDSMGAAMWEILQKGWATPAELDLAVKCVLGVRTPITGIVQKLDFTGLDLVNDIIHGYGVTNPYVEDMVKEGRLGAKTGKGFFDYGNQTEAEILKKRDLKYLRLLDCLTELDAFEPL